MRPVLPLVVLASALVGCGGGSSGTPAPAATYTISGTVSGSGASGVTLSLSGTASATTTTGASGSYSFGNLANGSYTVTPSLVGHTFSPASIAVSVNGADAAGKDFTASAQVLAPFQIVTLGATTFGASDLPRVRFWNGAGYSATLAATTPDPLQVAVPLYVDPVTGALASGTVSVTILRPDGTSTTLPGTVTIAAPPDLVGVPAGAVTAAFLEGSISLLASARAALLAAVVARPAASPLVTPELLAEMADSSARLTVMKTAVQGFLAGNPGAAIGSVAASDGPATVNVDAVTMKNSDRIIAAFLARIAPATPAATRGLASRAAAVPYDLEFARTWGQSLPAEISGQWLEWGKKVGGTIGAVTAVTGLAVALAASTPAVVAIGTTAAVVGAMGYAVSTFAPGACGAFLKIGSSILVDGQASQSDYMPEVKYVVGNTLAQGASQWLGTYLERVGGSLSAAVAGVLDDRLGFTAGAGELVAGAVDLVYPAACTLSIAPVSKPFISSGGAGTVDVTAGSGCAWTAVSGASWLAVTSGASGTGNGTVGYAVQANPTTAQRVGSILIAGIGFTITQAGSSSPSGSVDGTWLGGYTGTFRYVGGSTYQWNDEPMVVRIQDRVVLGASSGGTVDGSGNVTWQTQAGLVDGGAWTFIGTFGGNGSAGGTFSVSIPGTGPQSGTGSGTWTATRQ